MNSRKRNNIKYLFIIVAVIGLGTFLQPRLLNLLMPPARSYATNSFIQQGVSRQNIIREEFWEFRDRNNIGNFTQDPKLLLANSLLQTVSVKDFKPQLAYRSRSIQSLGGQTALSELPAATDAPKTTILIMTPLVKLFENESNEYILLTLTPLQEERKINGFLQKIKLVENKNYWLEISTIQK
jgi:hypothetical protein